jgi:hypothetical protein
MPANPLFLERKKLIHSSKAALIGCFFKNIQIFISGN